MKRYLQLYQTVLSLSLTQTMSYQQGFWVWVVVDTIWAVVNIGFFRVLLFAIPQLSGWTFETLALPLGILYLLNATIWGLMWPNLSEIPRLINKGDLDLFLTKPVNSQFLVSTHNISLNLFPSVVAGIMLLWYGFSVNRLPAFQILVLPVVLVSSTVISYAVWFLSITIAFWFNRLLNISLVFPHSVDVARYPITIFPPVIRFLLTYIVPFAMLGFLPAEVILGRINPVRLLLPIMIALMLLYLSHLFWNVSLRRYSSASS